MTNVANGAHRCSSIEPQYFKIQTPYGIDTTMTATAFVRARVNEELKNEATKVLVGMGLTVSDVVRIALTKIAKEKKLPFTMSVTNKLTAETLSKSVHGKDVFHAKNADDLFKHLGI